MLRRVILGLLMASALTGCIVRHAYVMRIDLTTEQSGRVAAIVDEIAGGFECKFDGPAPDWSRRVHVYRKCYPPKLENTYVFFDVAPSRRKMDIAVDYKTQTGPIPPEVQNFAGRVYVVAQTRFGPEHVEARKINWRD